MSGHTAEPWTMEPAFSARGERTGWLIQSAGRYIGDIHLHVGEDADDAQDEANARIAIAAPALYAAAVSTLQRLEADPEADQFLVRSLRSAVAQAEGRQS